MRRRPSLACLAMLAGVCHPAAAQEATAWVDVIVYRDGARLAGAALRLEAVDVRKATTDARGAAAFPHLRPGRYQIAANNHVATADQVLEVRAAEHLRVRVELSSREDSAAAIIVSAREQPAATHFSADDLAAVPRPTDVWSVLRDVPGVLLDRVNVGGSDTALQSLVVYRGDPGTGAVWSIDGVDVTDPAAAGSTAVYPDLDAVAEFDARSGSTDVRVRTPGVQIGLHLREAGARFSGSLHARGALDALQSDNLPPELAGHSLYRNRTERLLELAAEAGGPLRAGRLWLWGAASRTALRQATFTEHDDALRLWSFVGKGRLALGGGTLSLLALRAEKVEEDRDTGLASAPEARWRQSGPAHVVAVEDRRGWAGLSWLARVSFLDAGFRLEPHGGASASPYEDFRGVFRGSYAEFDTTRRRLEAGLEAAGRRRWAGLAHDFIAGAGLRRSPVATRYRWPGDAVLAFERQNVFFRTFELSGFALPTREQNARSRTDEAGLYAQDSVRAGRLGVTLGARVDRLSGRNLASSVAANPVFPDLLPAVSYAGSPARFRWLDLLPRAGISWEVKPGRLVAGASYAAYGPPLGPAEITFDSPVGRESASLTYYWIDRNGDHAVQRDELDALRGLLATSGVLASAPASTVSPHLVDPDLRSPRTHELSLSLEGRAGRFEGALHGCWRRQVHLLWAPLQGLTLADYAARGAVSGQLFGEPYTVVYFAPVSASRIAPGDGRILTNREGYRQDVFTVEADLRGAWRALRWRAWGALSDWRERFVDARATQDPTPIDAAPNQDAGSVAARVGGLGRDVFVNGRWSGGMSAEVGLPARFSAAANLYARDGFPVPYFVVASTGDPTGGSKNVLVARNLDTFRLPALLLLDARVGRGFRLRGGSLRLAADVFNLLNRSTALQVTRDVELSSLGRAREILRPRIVRVGLDYRF
ncbi:MAG TPA: hypothetical protein VGL15_16880 [Vicinamibacteria bacterium]